MATKEAIATGCGWCGSEAPGVKGRCCDCGGKLGLGRLATTKAGFARDDAARRADPLLGNPGAADAFRELWLAPVVLGSGALALGLSAILSGALSHGGRVGVGATFLQLGLVLAPLGAAAIGGGLLFRATRQPVLAKLMAVVWLVAVLALCPAVLRASLLAGPKGLGIVMGVLGVAFAPLVRASQLAAFLERQA